MDATFNSQQVLTAGTTAEHCSQHTHTHIVTASNPSISRGMICIQLSVSSTNTRCSPYHYLPIVRSANRSIEPCMEDTWSQSNTSRQTHPPRYALDTGTAVSPAGTGTTRTLQRNGLTVRHDHAYTAPASPPPLRYERNKSRL